MKTTTRRVSRIFLALSMALQVPGGMFLPAKARATAADDAVNRRRSSPIIVDTVNRRLWVNNPDTDTITLINPDVRVEDGYVAEYATDRHPKSVNFDASYRPWIACRDSDTVIVLNPANGQLVRRIQMARGGRPVSVVMNAAGTVAYVAEFASGRLRRFDTSTFNEIGSPLDVGSNPFAQVVTSDGARLAVSRFYSVGRTGGQVTVVNLGSWTVEGAVLLPADTTTVDGPDKIRGVPNYVAGLAIAPDDRTVYYVSKKDNVFKGTSTARDGQELTFDTSVRCIIGRMDIITRTEDVAFRIEPDKINQPSSIVLSPNGSVAMVPFQMEHRVRFYNTNTRQWIQTGTTSFNPQGIALDPTAGRLHTQDYLGRNTSHFNVTSILGGGTAIGGLGVITTIRNETMSLQQLTGKKFFYSHIRERDLTNPMTRDGYISCALCHLDGDSDRQVWDFTQRGEGLRNNISLRGRGNMNHGRVHWSANFDEMQDFEHDIRGAFGGIGFMTDGEFHTGTRDTPLGDPKTGVNNELDAIAAYLATLTETAPSPFRNQDGSLTADAVAGKAIFARQSCNSCHTGNIFTDSPNGMLHNVGTLKPTSGKRLNGPLPGIDTPSLKGLWASPPYFHDGSAETLMDVLTAPNNALHGRMDQLTAGERNQLVAYLNQIEDSETQPTAPALLSMTSAPAGGGMNTVTVTPAPGITLASVSVQLAGQSPIAAAEQPNGTWRATVPTGTAQVTAVRSDGGSTTLAPLTPPPGGSTVPPTDTMPPARPRSLRRR
jgi:DNA-binding beta-propeller fold protein YncE/mono/diheme cytochrome c family protein